MQLPLSRDILSMGIGALGAALLGFWLGQSVVSSAAARETKLVARQAIEAIREERHIAVSREINLWNEIIVSREQFIELAGAWERMDQITGEARRKMREELDRRTQAIESQRSEAERALNELREIKTDWGAQPVPDDIVCRVLRGDGCPKPSYPATDPGPAGNLEVRGGAAPAGREVAVPRGAAGDGQ